MAPPSAEEDRPKPWEEAQEPVLLRLIGAALGRAPLRLEPPDQPGQRLALCRSRARAVPRGSIETEQIADFELSLYDTQPAALGGAHGEYLYSARLDNLASCFVCTEALVSHATEHLAEDAEVSLVALFDHEEVGSASATGAASADISSPNEACDASATLSRSRSPPRGSGDATTQRASPSKPPRHAAYSSSEIVAVPR